MSVIEGHEGCDVTSFSSAVDLVKLIRILNFRLCNKMENYFLSRFIAFHCLRVSQKNDTRVD